MKHIRVAVLSGLVLIFGACGSSRQTWNINGFWGRWTEQPGRIAGFCILNESYPGQRNGGKRSQFQFRAGAIVFPLLNRPEGCIYRNWKFKRERDWKLRHVHFHAFPRSSKQRALPPRGSEPDGENLRNLDADRSERMHRDKRNLSHEPARVIPYANRMGLRESDCAYTPHPFQCRWR